MPTPSPEPHTQARLQHGDLARGTYADDRRYAVSLHLDL